MTTEQNTNYYLVPEHVLRRAWLVALDACPPGADGECVTRATAAYDDEVNAYIPMVYLGWENPEPVFCGVRDKTFTTHDAALNYACEFVDGMMAPYPKLNEVEE